MILFIDKHYERCIDYLYKTNIIKITENDSTVFTSIIAKCFELTSNYEESAKYYKKQNNVNRDSRFTYVDYIKSLNSRAQLNISSKLIDSKSNYFIMTGFPRSGTTLLENALASHPKIATCEETSSLTKAINTAFTWPIIQDANEEKNINFRAQYCQKIYYENLDRYVFNKDETCIIDKTPILSANIKFMEKIFPTKKYIFSIRHPYDVIISNFKQSYEQNIAMAAFNDMYEACILYNKVMTDWFDVFPDETDRVCYIYYDDLVLDFQNQMERALSFLGVEWTDEVLNFMEHSKKRSIKTPSYANVRKGLGIGVQTSWKNFDFLFDDKCIALLEPWVKKFGYIV
jgi:hypothetical protein